MIIVRGVNLYPSAIDNLIRSVRDIVEYEVNIRRIMGMDDLLIRLETSGSRSFEAVSGDVRLVFRNHFNIRVSIEQAADGSLPRYEFKARRFRRTCER
jgi:phenylacetate-CoA ligase